MTRASDGAIREITAMLLKFRRDRDWGQFHSPKNLAISISIEAAELLEHFQWNSENEPVSPEEKQEVAKELADIFNYVIMLAEDLGIDIVESSREKIKENAKKYPVKKAKGSAKKYKDL